MPVARGVTTGRGLQPIEQVIRARESLAARQKPVASSADQAVLELFGEGYDQARPSEFQKALRTPVTHVWPLPKATAQRLSSGYGMRNDPFDGGRDFHEGIDIAAASGTPVMASAAGVVSKVSSQGPSGKRVSIEHADGSESTYIHLSKQNVREGQNVRQGQVIGAVGSTGRSTGPHLDYRLKKRGHYVNPLSALRPTATTRLALR
jgi:murein DD-endopeptidase MepM/ murein hydrolase activator NlpD